MIPGNPFRVRPRPIIAEFLLCAALCVFAWGCGSPRSRAAVAHTGHVLFSEVAAQSGIHFVHRNGQGAGANIIETTGTGCGLFDYDNDGWLDVYLVNGKSPPGDGNHLYHNNGDGTFTDVTAKAGVAGLGHGFGMGCTVGDYDGDGWIDLYVTYYGKNILYHNEGNGTFRDVTARAGVGAGGFSTSAVFADFDGDGLPDLYVARYCQITKDTKLICYLKGYPSSCPPYYYPPEPDLVYRNMGNGTFQDVTRQWGLQESSGRGLATVAVDYDRDGLLDLFVTNDGSPNFLYRNLGHGHFKSVGALEGVALTDAGAAVANMGCDFGDFMGDGTFGVITGVFENEEKPLWRYERKMGFQYYTRQSGLSAPTLSLLTWGIGFEDFDNDGRLDLFMANGHVQDHADQIDPRSHYRQPRTYFVNVGNGRFEDRTQEGGPALTTPAVGRGAAFGDVFNDGRIDVLVNNNNGPAMLVRNEQPPGNWAEFRLVARGPSWEAIGAVVELKAGGIKQTRFVHTSYSFASANDPRVHFGLGNAAGIEWVKVTWPDGRKSEYRHIGANRISTLVEPGAHIPSPFKRLLISHR